MPGLRMLALNKKAAPIMKTLSDAELLERIRVLRSSAYRNLSKFHTELLTNLEFEARTRNLKI